MMTPAEFAEKMKHWRAVAVHGGDPEQAHCEADDLMCQVLREAGFGEGVDIYEDPEFTRWFA